jgi:hypothetical protein
MFTIFEGKKIVTKNDSFPFFCVCPLGRSVFTFLHTLELGLYYLYIFQCPELFSFRAFFFSVEREGSISNMHPH